MSAKREIPNFGSGGTNSDRRRLIDEKQIDNGNQQPLRTNCWLTDDDEEVTFQTKYNKTGFIGYKTTYPLLSDLLWLLRLPSHNVWPNLHKTWAEPIGRDLWKRNAAICVGARSSGSAVSTNNSKISRETHTKKLDIIVIIIRNRQTDSLLATILLFDTIKTDRLLLISTHTHAK